MQKLISAPARFPSRPPSTSEQDAAFILSYSVIMLHTDAHNVNIKPEKKMTKDNFLRNNRGIANGNDLPSELLTAIYDSIVTRPFTLREDDALRSKLAEKSGVTVDAATRRAAEQAERDKLFVEGKAAMSASKAAEKGRTYFSRDDVGSTENLADHARAMFDVAWGPLLATFSINFETVSNENEADPLVQSLIFSCLRGFNQLIHVSCMLRQNAERDILCGTLARFTALDSSARELRSKHIHAVKSLLAMTNVEGPLLGTAWGPLLQVISSVARFINVAMGLKDDSAFLPGATGKPSAPVDRREAERLRLASERESAIERQNAAVIAAQVSEAEITKIYTRSTSFPTEGITDFVTQLAAVSLSELSAVVNAPSGFPVLSTLASSNAGGQAVGPPRIFSLQKVIEVADFNMDVRPRMVWSRIWDTLGRFFTAVCTSTNDHVSVFAIDSLKQLSLKFLEKPELKSFSFQTRFLQPLVAIMEVTSPSSLAAAKAAGSTSGVKSMREVREFILQVSANLIRARTKNIRSGWSSLLCVFAAASSDTDQVLVSLAFSMAHEVLDTHWAAISSSGAFVDAVKAMIAFSSNKHELFALRAVDHCSTLGARLARGRVPLSEDPASAEAEFEATAAAAAALSRARADGADNSASPPSALSSADWYDLDSPENADVVDDVRDRELLASLPSDPSAIGVPVRGSSGAAAVISSDDNAGDASASGTVAGLEELEPEAAAEAAFHLQATRSAMQSADDVRGGFIRRFTDSAPHLRLWWPLLTGLAGLISSDPRTSVRMRALHALTALLRRYGPGFSKDLWRLIYSGVLLPVFDDVTSAHTMDSPTGAGTPPPHPARDMEGGESAAKPHYSLAEFSTRAIPSPALVDPSVSRALNLWPRGARGVESGVHEWLSTTCMASLSALVRLQGRFFARNEELLQPLLQLIENCIDQDIEGLARIGVACFRLLLAEAGPRFNEYAWDLTTSALVRLFTLTTPNDLLAARRKLLGATAEEEAADAAAALIAAAEAAQAAAVAAEEAARAAVAVGAPVSTPYGPGVIEVAARDDGFTAVRLPWAVAFVCVPPPQRKVEAAAVAAPSKPTRPPGPNPNAPPKPLPFNGNAVITQCVVQLELIGAVSVLADAHIESLSLKNVETLLGLLQSSADFARRFNGDRTLRRALWEAGFMRVKHAKLPSLLRQETCATQSLLVLLLRLYAFDGEKAGKGGSPWRDLSLRGLSELIAGIVKRYHALAADVQRAQVLALPSFMHASLQFTIGGGGAVTRDAASDELLQGDHSRDLFREAAAYGPLVLQLLDGLLGFDDTQFKSNLP